MKLTDTLKSTITEKAIDTLKVVSRKTPKKTPEYFWSFFVYYSLMK